MDARHFVTLARSLTTVGFRRRALVLALSGTLAPLLGRTGTDAHNALTACKKKSGKAKKKCLKKAKAHNAAHTSAPPLPPVPPCPGLKPTDDLQAAIAAAAPGATLTLCARTWLLSAPVLINKNLTLVGAGAGQSILDGGRSDSGSGGVQVLQVAAGVIVTLQDLTITKGSAPADGYGGGILNQGTLTLRGVSVKGNSAGNSGGGISNQGTLTLVSGSRVTGNTAINGGGISTEVGSRLTLQDDSRVTENTAGSFGGGIYNLGTVRLVSGSSVTENTAESSGGGIFNSFGTVTLEFGSSVTDNTAQFGGGISSDGTVTLQAGSSVRGNQADPTDPDSGGGIYNEVGATLTVEATGIVAGNTPGDCAGALPTSGTCG